MMAVSFRTRSSSTSSQAERKGGLRFEPVGKSPSEAKLGILHLPQTYRAAYIIDGQHRLYGYANSDRAGTDLVPVVAFVDMPGDEQVRSCSCRSTRTSRRCPRTYRTRSTLTCFGIPGTTTNGQGPSAFMSPSSSEIASHRRCSAASNSERTLRRHFAVSRSRPSTTAWCAVTSLALSPRPPSRSRARSTLAATSRPRSFCFRSLKVHSGIWSRVSRGKRRSETARAVSSSSTSVYRGNPRAPYSDIIDHLKAHEDIDPLKAPTQELVGACEYFLDPLIDAS